ncbi:MAG TPA: DUF87 domain-containing protein [Nitrososphaerales archaeon]|nr:DUF87 domain-containing protein [Nitrososphaerales archaeon]
MSGSIFMGWSRAESLRAGGPVEIPISALTRHICILGATGSGKSTTASIIARGLASNGISTVILDRTGEYVRLKEPLENTRVYQPGNNLVMALLHFDADASLGVQVEGWLGMLNHYTTVTFGSQISPLQSRVLREVLTKYYTGTHEVLTVSKLIAKLEAYEDRFRRRSGWEESIEALISRLVPLTVDLVGRTFNLPYTSLELGSLFEGSISIFDMSAMEEDGAKNLLSQMVLKRLYQLMRTRDITDEVNLVVILDEAQHLAPNQDYFSIPERCAIELRKYGFSLVTIATRPSLISPNILSNSSTVISHVLINERDIDAVLCYLLDGSENSAMKRAVRTLPTGSAVVQRNFPVPVRPLVCSIDRRLTGGRCSPIQSEPITENSTAKAL